LPDRRYGSGGTTALFPRITLISGGPCHGIVLLLAALVRAAVAGRAEPALTAILEAGSRADESHPQRAANRSSTVAGGANPAGNSTAEVARSVGAGDQLDASGTDRFFAGIGGRRKPRPGEMVFPIG
jgi:hypothetical protein